MFEFTVKTQLDAPLKQVWAYLINLDQWWIASNPEHIELIILSTFKKLAQGTEIQMREKIAGIPGVAHGVISEYKEYERVTWRAEKAKYRYFGLSIVIDEQVTWQLRPDGEKTLLSATVDAGFPRLVLGGFIEWFFKNALNGIENVNYILLKIILITHPLTGIMREKFV